MSTLIIAEKPSVAGDIAKILGATKSGPIYLSQHVCVASARGHLVEMTAPDDPGFVLERLPVIPKHWKLEVIDGAGPAIQVLRQAVNRSEITEVVNACDAGREGELIFRLIAEFLNCRKPITRMWLQSMTKDGIERAWRERKPASEYDALASAARSRAIADWVVGINATRALTKANFVANGELVSAGRVQTPTLALLVDRELAIDNFVSRDFWEVEAEFTVGSAAWRAKWVNPFPEPETRWSQVFDQTIAESVRGRNRAKATTRISDVGSEERQHAPLPFDLTSLQREANKRHGLSAAETLATAQRLYEVHKVTTYPRTDSAFLPTDYVEQAKTVMRTLPGAYTAFVQRVADENWIVASHRVFNDKKISDHFAIIPTGNHADLLGADAVVYELICKRFVACFFPAAVIAKTTRNAWIGADQFRVIGSRVVEAGWWEVYGRDDVEKDVANLPSIAEGTQATANQIKLLASKTKPPERYTDATLLSAMEHGGRKVDLAEATQFMKQAGLGTPATRASMIEALLSVKKGYAVRERKFLCPKAKAMRLIQALRDNGLASLASAEMTMRWEDELHHVETGAVDASVFVDRIGQFTQQLVSTIRGKAVVSVGEQPTGATMTCRCGKATLVETRNAWGCASCPLRIWKTVASRVLDRADIEALVANGETGALSGFVSKKNKPFSAALRLETDGRVNFVFDGARN